MNSQIRPEEITDSDLLDERGRAVDPFVPTESTRVSRPPPPPPRYPSYPHSAAPRGAVSGDPFSARPGDLLASKYLIEQPPIRLDGVLAFPVRHAELGQRFILKCLIPEACGDPDAVAKFLRGARAAIHLTSEHTARTVDAGRFPSNVPYTVSEALSGCDLREMLRVRGALAPTEAVDLILQACEALAEAHANGLVHRRLSLSTLFATRRPGGTAFIKVMDFGIADVLGGIGPARGDTYLQFSTTPFPVSQVGEPIRCYAPEQIRGVKDIDGRADIWALGAILHELLSGAPLFSAASVPCLLAMIVADAPVPITSVRSDVPAGLEAVILRCLEKERRARFPSVADFAVALRSFASHEARGSIERITRTLAQGRATVAPVSTSALVHVGSPEEPRRAEPPAPPPAPALPQSGLLWGAAIIALGQIAGVATALLITRAPARDPLAGYPHYVTDVSRARPAAEERALPAAEEPASPATAQSIEPHDVPPKPRVPVASPVEVAPSRAPASAGQAIAHRAAGQKARSSPSGAGAERAATLAQKPRERTYTAPRTVPERSASVQPDLFDSVQ